MKMLEGLSPMLDKLYRSMPVFMPRRLKVLRDKSGRLLDLGCGPLGPKRLGNLFQGQIEYHGVDIQDLRPITSKSWNFYQLDLDKDRLPFPSETFDLAVMSHILEHLCDPCRAVCETHRVLKHGGILYCEVPSVMSIFVPSISFGLRKEGTINFYDDPTHHRPFSKIALVHRLTSCGFKIIRTGTARNWIKVLAAPIGILLAFAVRDRCMLASFLWDIFGCAVFAVAKKERQS
jgi:SAM-dependent methyltransferase